MSVDSSQLISPIQQTPLSQQGKSLQLTQLILSDGLATYPADILRKQTQAKILSNLLQSRRRGIWTNRDCGWVRGRSSTFNSGAAILDFGIFYTPTGTAVMLFQAGSKLYSYDLTTHTETQLLTGLNATAVPCMRPFMATAASSTPITIYTSSKSTQAAKITAANAAAVFNLNGGTASNWGSTAAPLAVKTYASPAFCEPYGNRMVYGGFDATTNTSTGMDVLITNFGTYDTVSQSGTLLATDGGVFTVPPILGPITGIRSKKLSNQTNDEVVIIGCQRGVAVITGTDATDYSLKIATREFGIVSNRTWVDLMNDLLFVADDGVRTFSNLAINSNLLTSSLTFELQDLINSFDKQHLANIWAIHHRDTKDVQFWFPLAADGSSGQCQHALVMNYAANISGPQTTITPCWSTRDGTAVASGTEFPDQNTGNTLNPLVKTFYGGGYDGLLQKHYNGNLFDTTPVPFQAVFALASNGNPALGQSVRKVVFLTSGGSQKFIANAYFYETQGDQYGSTIRRGAPQSNTLLQAPSGSGTALGTWVLGVSAFPSDYTRLVDFEPSGEGRFLELQVLGNSSDHYVDLLGAEIILSGGGTRR